MTSPSKSTVYTFHRHREFPLGEEHTLLDYLRPTADGAHGQSLLRSSVDVVVVVVEPDRAGTHRMWLPGERREEGREKVGIRIEGCPWAVEAFMARLVT